MELAPVAAAAADLESELVRVYPSLARRLTFVLGDADRADDVAQSAIARALERRSSFRGGDVRAWLYTIGLRLAFNELRRQASLRARAAAASEPTWAMSVDPDLWIALADLPVEHRAALVLSVLEGYTHAEIGRLLGVPDGTISSWLSRTKAHLRMVLGDDR
jgi:RNA polymerase sigma-70 factor (ECF subfamily)